jgi:hypothetical protein
MENDELRIRFQITAPTTCASSSSELARRGASEAQSLKSEKRRALRGRFRDFSREAVDNAQIAVRSDDFVSDRRPTFHAVSASS